MKQIYKKWPLCRHADDTGDHAKPPNRRGEWRKEEQKKHFIIQQGKREGRKTEGRLECSGSCLVKLEDR